MLIMATVIGAIGSALVDGDMPGGIIGAMVAGFVGAWLGSQLFGVWGPVFAGFAIVPAIIGAAAFVFVLRLLVKRR
ncbi:GlsB/YeaQ/YmgE family stress response membrane protein [Bacillus lumedeiriae]